MVSGPVIFITVAGADVCNNPLIAYSFALPCQMKLKQGVERLIGSPFSILFANFICALAFSIKTIAEPTLLYDSVSTRGGEGLYSKLDAKGGSGYYILDGIASLVSGYLFVYNNYLPMYVCLGFIIISTILSFGFHDVYDVKTINKEKDKKHIFKEYKEDLISSIKFILKSKRMKAYVLFEVVFYSLICIIDTYRSELLIDIGIPEEQFSMIFAVLALIGGISLSLKKPIEKKLKNRTLSLISMTYVSACIIIGLISSIYIGKGIIPVILIIYSLQRVDTSIWYILKTKYLNNFTNENTRNKISFAYEFIGCIAASIFSILGGLLLNILDVNNAYLIVGLLFLVFMVLTLDYMRTRIGLKPEEYKKEDIEFEVNN